MEWFSYCLKCVSDVLKVFSLKIYGDLSILLFLVYLGDLVIVCFVFLVDCVRVYVFFVYGYKWCRSLNDVNFFVVSVRG